MEGDGKTSKDDTSITEQESLPPLAQDDMTVIEDADLSTGYNCLRFLMVNQFMSKRLSPNEYTWIFREWRRQFTTLTKNGAKTLTNPMIPDSELTDVRLTREAEFKLYMASALREAGLKTRDRGFLQSRCQRCFRRPSRIITCKTCCKQVGPGCCMAWESPK